MNDPSITGFSIGFIYGGEGAGYLAITLTGERFTVIQTIDKSLAVGLADRLLEITGEAKRREEDNG